MAKTPERVSKIAEIRFVGEEPILKYVDRSNDSEYSRAMNWYSYQFDITTARQWLNEYVELHRSKIDLRSIKKLSDNYVPMSACSRAKMILNGTTFSDELMSKFDESLDNLIRMCQNVKEVVESADVVVITKQAPADKLKTKIQEFIGDIEVELDNFIEGKYLKPFSMSMAIKSRNAKPPYVKAALEYYGRLLAELQLIKTDEDIKYAYRHMTRGQITAYIKQVQSIVDDCQASLSAHVQIKQLNKAPRKVKTKPASIQVSKVQYKKEDQEFGLKSVDPKELIGAKHAWLFNTKYRMIQYYEAATSSGFSVKGTTLNNIDTAKSNKKKVRKIEQLKSLETGTKSSPLKFMDSIKCKPSAVNGRINSDTLILKVIK